MCDCGQGSWSLSVVFPSPYNWWSLLSANKLFRGRFKICQGLGLGTQNLWHFRWYHLISNVSVNPIITYNTPIFFSKLIIALMSYALHACPSPSVLHLATSDFVCSLLLVSIQANISNGHQERVLSPFCACISLWPCRLKPIRTVLPCSTHLFFDLPWRVGDARKKSIYKGCHLFNAKNFIIREVTQNEEESYTNPDFFLTPWHSRPFHPRTRRSSFRRCWGVRLPKTYGVRWLDWHGETWSMMSRHEDTELVYGTSTKHWLQWLGEEREHLGMEFLKDMHLQVQLWTTQHGKFGQQNDDAQTASRFVEAGQRQLEPKKLCHLIHLSAPWRLFLYWKTYEKMKKYERMCGWVVLWTLSLHHDIPLRVSSKDV